MRILVSSPTFLPAVGGAELGIHEIYDRLGRDHEVIVLAPKPGDQDPHVAEDHASANYRVERLLPALDAAPSLVRRGARRSPAAYFWEMGRIARSWKPDVLNPHFVMRQAAAAIHVGRATGTPVAISLVGRSDVVHRMSPFARNRARAALRSADLVFANSGYYLQGEPRPSNLAIIPYGVDLSAYTPSARSEVTRERLGLVPDDIAVLTVQRLAPVKRVDVLLYALKLALEREPRLVLVVVGKGEEEQRLRALAADLGIESRVRFAGYVAEADLPSVYASSELFAFHSLQETFGVVFAQAMATGLPIVAAATSCVPEVVHPENGALASPFDVGAFADEVVALASDRERLESVGRTNVARASAEFDWDQIASRYETEMARVGRP